MKTPFDSSEGLIIVNARVWGPSGPSFARLALDTGATITTFNADIIVSMGYDPACARDRRRMTTASNVEYVAQLELDRIEVLGQERTRFPVVCHTLPPSATVDGLLGLNFFRNQVLTIDFRNGTISLGTGPQAESII